MEPLQSSELSTQLIRKALWEGRASLVVTALAGLACYGVLPRLGRWQVSKLAVGLSSFSLFLLHSSALIYREKKSIETRLQRVAAEQQARTERRVARQAARREVREAALAIVGRERGEASAEAIERAEQWEAALQTRYFGIEGQAAWDLRRARLAAAGEGAQRRLDNWIRRAPEMRGLTVDAIMGGEEWTDLPAEAVQRIRVAKGFTDEWNEVASAETILAAVRLFDRYETPGDRRAIAIHGERKRLDEVIRLEELPDEPQTRAALRLFGEIKLTSRQRNERYGTIADTLLGNEDPAVRESRRELFKYTWRNFVRDENKRFETARECTVPMALPREIDEALRDPPSSSSAAEMPVNISHADVTEFFQVKGWNRRIDGTAREFEVSIVATAGHIIDQITPDRLTMAMVQPGERKAISEELEQVARYHPVEAALDLLLGRAHQGFGAW